jgi:hypothetical protein
MSLPVTPGKVTLEKSWVGERPLIGEPMLPNSEIDETVAVHGRTFSTLVPGALPSVVTPMGRT